MSRCWSEGELRAHLDGELAGDEIEAVSQHLRECEACTALFEDLSGRAAQVSVWMAALESIPAMEPIPLSGAGSRWQRRATAVGLVLAAACVVLILVLPRKTVRQTPIKPPASTLLARAIPAAVGPSSDQLAKKSAAEPLAQYYMVLDDEPIESGVVVRVTLPGSGLLADVVYDEQGRPRAVRPLN